MHERFSDRARHAMALANLEATNFNHNFLSPAHTLLGLIAEGKCVATETLRVLDVDLDKVREEVRQEHGTDGIEVDDLRLRIGVGGGEGSQPDKGSGFGGGGGGGVLIEPAVFLILEPDKISVIPAKKQGALDAILQSAPEVFEVIKKWASKKSAEGESGSGDSGESEAEES